VEFHLLGRVDFATCLALQQRLVHKAGEFDAESITVLLCEHPDIITIGRAGSRGHIRMGRRELTSRGLEVRWIGRGGGCILHSPGQLAVYPIVPLAPYAWTVGNYLQRLRQALAASLVETGVRVETRPDRFGIWGRTGQLVAVGAAVRDWVTYHGAFINVHPAMGVYRFIDSGAGRALPPGERATMSCLLAERGKTTRMTTVRASVVANLAAALDCDRYHLHTGHPLLPQLGRSIRETTAHTC